MRHVGAPHRGELDPLAGHAAGLEGAPHVFPERRRAAFRAHEQEARALGAAHHLGPCGERVAAVLVGVVHGAEGDAPAAFLRRAGLDPDLLVKAQPAQHHPGVRQRERCFEQQRRVFRLEVGVDQDVVDAAQARGVRVAQPADLHRCRAPGHHLELVHLGGGAELEQDVEVVVGDQLRRVARRDVGHAAEGVDGAGDVLLHLVRLAREPGVAVEREAGAVVALEQRQREVGHGVVAQVRGHDAHPDAPALLPAWLPAQRRARRNGVDAAAPECMVLHQQAPLGRRADPLEVVQQRRRLVGQRPVAAQRLEAAQPVGGGEVAAALQHRAQYPGVAHQVAAELQAAQGEPVGLLDVLALVAAAGAVQAVGQRHQKLQLARRQAHRLVEMPVCRVAVKGRAGVPELGVRPGRIGLPRHHLLQVGAHRVAAPGAAQHLRLGDPQAQAVRDRRQAALDHLQRLVVPLHVGQQRGRTQPGALVLRLEAPRQLEVVQRLLEVPGHALRHAEQPLVFAFLRHGADQPPEGFHRPRRVARVDVDIAAVGQRRHIPWLGLLGPGKGLQGFGVALLVLQHHAEQVVECEVLRVARQALARARLGRRMLAGLEQRAAQLKERGLGDRLVSCECGVDRRGPQRRRRRRRATLRRRCGLLEAILAGLA